MLQTVHRAEQKTSPSQLFGVYPKSKTHFDWEQKGEINKSARMRVTLRYKLQTFFFFLFSHSLFSYSQLALTAQSVQAGLKWMNGTMDKHKQFFFLKALAGTHLKTQYWINFTLHCTINFKQLYSIERKVSFSLGFFHLVHSVFIPSECSSIYTYSIRSSNEQQKILILIAGWAIYILWTAPTQVWHFVTIYLHAPSFLCGVLLGR